MPLMLVDLDNTLIDRDAAFRAAVNAFLQRYGLPSSDLSWIMALDRSGYTPRDIVASAMADRYGRSTPEAAIQALLDNGGADRVVLHSSSKDALLMARVRGWTCVIVTNGRTAQQEAKIYRAGLDRLVKGWVVSERVGHKKPAAEIFRAAADLGGLPLHEAWVIGDSPQADIAGAAALGLQTVWVSNNRAWTQDDLQPTEVAVDVATAIHKVCGTASS
ncbi:HAD family hydrolase [Actinoplanes sp. NPDC051346]|uniref:HAD family hydrolase n=1 Tax=Actinoplanes sp. NPDC051346 TaxID=3155048 RepID=UPI003425383F